MGIKQSSIMECVSMATYFLFFANFLVFVLAVAVFSCSIWILHDKPGFFHIMEKASEVCGDGSDCGGLNASLSLFSTAAGLMIFISIVVIIVSFLGCCGAIRKSRCMITDFGVIMAISFTVMIFVAVGVHNNHTDLQNKIEKPFIKAMKLYNDNPDTTDGPAKAYKRMWDELQHSLHCCGVNNVTDWSVYNRKGATNFNFKGGDTKPLGCCMLRRDGTEITGKDVDVCRKVKIDVKSPKSTTYYWNGCYVKTVNKIKHYSSVAITLGIFILLFKFLNIVAAVILFFTARW